MSALMLSFIVLAFMSVIATAFTQSTRSDVESYVGSLRRDRARLLEHVVLINVDLSNGITLWLFNPGSCSVEVREVYVDGVRATLSSPVTIPPGMALPLKLNSSLNPGRKHEFAICTSNGGVFKFEAAVK